MTDKKTNYFAELDRVDITKHIEKKGKFNYLSWTYAVRELKRRHPGSTWTIHEYGEEKFPYVKTECGFFVKVTVDVEGIKMTQVHPVLDHQNKAITAPNAFQINTSIQRCLAKAIALHGLGIHIYAGEDLPPSPPLDKMQQKELLDLLKERNAEKELLGKVMDQISNETLNQGNFLKAMEYYTNSL
tara:strand:- start:115 stop:672 length:558 start_codon:yes stop_codon:yes gene_type:complete